MATPAEIRRARKASLRYVQRELRKLDSRLEILERLIKRVLGVKKRFPDNDDAIDILTALGQMDTQLNSTVKAANDFASAVLQF